VRHIFNGSVVAISTWHGGRTASFLLSGWQIAPLVRLTTGLPFNITTGADNSRTGIALDRPNVVAGGQPYIHNSPHLKTGIPYLSGSAFVANPVGTFGNVKHFGYYAPHYTDVDMSVSRNFHLYERLALQARVDGFNVLNHPNFLAPATVFGSTATFGRITTAQDPRILQGSLKFTF
jgi:hypothetical protein